LRLVTLKKRSDFLRLRDAGHKAVRPDFVLQAAPSVYDDADAIHLGFTATKKLGNAVVRNRTKRRLRAAAQAILPDCGQAGVDYVLIGRKNTVHSPFDALCKDLKSALAHVNKRLS
jgi:ribonuclease P protein component